MPTSFSAAGAAAHHAATARPGEANLALDHLETAAGRLHGFSAALKVFAATPQLGAELRGAILADSAEAGAIAEALGDCVQAFYDRPPSAAGRAWGAVQGEAAGCRDRLQGLARELGDLTLLTGKNLALTDAVGFFAECADDYTLHLDGALGEI